MSTPKEIYIIRHGETDFNKRGIVQGRGVNSDLNETGRKQALCFYKKYSEIPFDKIYTSTLKRTHQSVESFIHQGLPWEQLSGLDELDWGKFEGKESNYELKRHFYSLTEDWTKGKLNKRIPQGESPMEVNVRQKQALMHILSKQEESKVLICMHGRALRLLLCELTKNPLTKMDTYPHQNLSLYKVDYHQEEFIIKEFNNIDHLEIKYA